MLWEELRTVKGFAEALWFSQKLAWAIDRVRDAANELKQLGFATVAGPLIGPVKRRDGCDDCEDRFKKKSFPEKNSEG
ncbi:MAG TPA: hypothetical protein P5260_09255 [Candidatus Competibacter sp.]|nr:hypothetical protein [Candidatus Competibacter sp.]HRX61384.1 hypothetical protein [Candidatus Competibacter sp.]